MGEKKFVTLEMLEKYHEHLMKHITGNDGLISKSETCPKCGSNLVSVILTPYPLITKKECMNCDWQKTDEEE